MMNGTDRLPVAANLVFSETLTNDNIRRSTAIFRSEIFRAPSHGLSWIGNPPHKNDAVAEKWAKNIEVENNNN